MNKEEPPIRAVVDQWRKIRTQFDRFGIEIYPTFSP
jgi:hypothetical protein